MASSYGDWVNYGTNSWARLKIYIDDPEASTVASQSIRAAVGLSTSSSMYDSTNTLTMNGTNLNDKTVSNIDVSLSVTNGGAGQVEKNYMSLTDVTTSVAASYTTAKTLTMACSFGPLAGGITPTHSLSVTLPKRQYSAPGVAASVALSAPSSTSIALSWDDPSSTGGADADDIRYLTQYSTDGSSYTGGAYTTGKSRTVTGLQPNTKYWMRIQADNSHLSQGGGTSTWVTVSVTTPAEAPSAIPSVTVSLLTVSSARLSWTAPSDWGGDNTGTYRVEIHSDSGYTSQVWAVTGSGTTRDPSGLSAGQTYYYRIRAQNSGGNGPWKTGSFTLLSGVPSAPGAVSFTSPLSTTANASWPASSTANGGGTITYTLELSTSPVFATIAKTVTTTATSVALTGLTPGTVYYSRVTASTSYGSSAPTEGALLTTASAPGEAPVLSLVSPGPSGASVSWTAITDWGAATGTYTLRWRVSGGDWTTVTGITATSYSLPTLLPNSTYEAEVFGVNSYGSGPASNLLSWATSAPPVYVKIAGTWRAVTAIYVKVSGVWRPVTRVWVKVSGVWR